MRDRPDGSDLLALVKRIEDGDASVSLPDDERYKDLMLAHAKAIAERQAEMSAAHEEREQEDLQNLLGGDGDLPGLNREFAAMIRAGDFDPGASGSGAARKHLWQTARDRVRESNPKALEGPE